LHYSAVVVDTVAVQLRDHPLMSYRGMPNWPPAWSTLAIRSKPGPRGEVGTLEEVLMNNLYDDRIFMAILYEGYRYLGCLIFDDASFCFQIFAFLKLNRGKQIKDIGDSDLAHTL